MPPHALALYQQQITKAHESAREDMPPSKLSQQQQAEKEQQQPSSSPRGKSRSPAVGEKEGRAVCVLVRVYPRGAPGVCSCTQPAALPLLGESLF